MNMMIIRKEDKLRERFARRQKEKARKQSLKKKNKGE